MARLGLQMWTVREEAKKDLFGTLRMIAEMGYEGVEFADGIMETPYKSLREVLDETGLSVVGAVFQLLEPDIVLDDIIRYSKEISSPAVVYPGIKDEFTSIDQCNVFAQKMLHVAEKCNMNGLKFMYHVHGKEFNKIGETTCMDMLLKAWATGPVLLEVDVYWVEWAGVDAVGFLEKHASISPYIHFKDMKNREGRHDTEVGEGCLDMESIARVGRLHDSEWFIVEQEEFDIPVLKSVKISLKSMKKLVL